MQSSVTYGIESTAQKEEYIGSGQNLSVRKGYQESEEIDHHDGEGACCCACWSEGSHMGEENGLSKFFWFTHTTEAK